MGDNVYTIEELQAMIDEQRGHEAAEETTTSTVRTVTVDGLTVSVDTRKLSSWKAARLIARVDNPDTKDFQRVAAMMDLYELVFADDFGKVLDHFGGEDVANVQQVMQFFNALMDALDQKK